MEPRVRFLVALIVEDLNRDSAQRPPGGWFFEGAANIVGRDLDLDSLGRGNGGDRQLGLLPRKFDLHLLAGLDDLDLLLIFKTGFDNHRHQLGLHHRDRRWNYDRPASASAASIISSIISSHFSGRRLRRCCRADSDSERILRRERREAVVSRGNSDSDAASHAGRRRAGERPACGVEGHPGG